MRPIIRSRASELKIILSPQATRYLTTFCRGNPRKARHLLEALTKSSAVLGITDVSVDNVKRFMKSLGFDGKGRSQVDRNYLRTLTRQGGENVSLSTLALSLDLDKDHVAQTIEPWLVEQGWIGIRATGRHLTVAGWALVKEDAENTK